MNKYPKGRPSWMGPKPLTNHLHLDIILNTVAKKVGKSSITIKHCMYEACKFSREKMAAREVVAIGWPKFGTFEAHRVKTLKEDKPALKEYKEKVRKAKSRKKIIELNEEVMENKDLNGQLDDILDDLNKLDMMDKLDSPDKLN